MNLLVINCSPVRSGATAEIVEQVCSNAKELYDVRAVCIDDYRINLCKGCRKCHITASCFQKDDVDNLMVQFEWADIILCVSPSYWADVPGQFKVFIDRCTPWCNTHDPHRVLSPGKKGYAIALRTGPGKPECERIISTIVHFYGHLEITFGGSLCLCGVENRGDAEERAEEIKDFCNSVLIG